MSTPKYNLLYESFGWEKPTYIHLPLVLGEDGQKLSKRNGDASFMDLYNDGFLPEAIVNYLALLGWAPSNNEEIFSLDELVKNFDAKRISKAPATYDIKKLKWINAHYIKQLSLDDLLKITLPHLKQAYHLEDKTDEWIRELIGLYQNHITYGKEIVEVTSNFFSDKIELDEECIEFMKDETIPQTLKVFKEEIQNITEWTTENISNAINNTKDKSGAKGKMLYMPIRIKTTGIMHGPELPNTIHLIGKEEIIKRLEK